MSKDTDKIMDGSLDPKRIYTTKYLAQKWGRKDVRRFEEALESRGVRLCRLGNGLSLVTGDALWGMTEGD